MGKLKLLLGLLITLTLLFGMAYTDDDTIQEQQVVEQVCETGTVVKVK
jgi:Phr family secreted Rap phosphatase inhibitor